MAIASEYTFDVEAVLDAALRGRARSLGGGSLLGTAPWLVVERDRVIAAMDESELPPKRWFRKRKVPVRREYPLPEIQRYVRSADRLRVFRDPGAGDGLVVTRDSAIRFAVGNVEHLLGIAPPELPDDSGYVTVAGQRLAQGESRVVGDFEVTLIECGPWSIPSRPVLVAQGRRDIPRETLLGWARGVKRLDGWI